jgi:microcystin-dependent protein
MSEPFLGEIRMFSFDFAPKGWAMCNGQLLQINQNQALFSLLGTTYGGDGQQTFALPDLRGRLPFHVGTRVQGQMAGTESETLNLNQMPAHTHAAQASSTTGTAATPGGNFWAAAAANPYASSNSSTMSAQAVTSAGGSQPHNNLPPFLVLNVCMALLGIFPSRN